MIYFIYFSIFFRIIPLCLQWISYKRKNLYAQFFFGFSALSLVADIASFILVYFHFHTDALFNLYQIGEVIIITLLSLSLGNIAKIGRSILISYCFLQVLASILILAFNQFDAYQDYNAGVTKVYIIIILFLSAVRYIQFSETTRKIDIAPLIGLLGIFIFEALSIIPIISQQIQRLSGNPQQITIIYLILVIAGNLIRDVLVSYNAILNLKKSP